MATRDSLLDVTAKLYAEHGWRGTTTRRIAEAAGVNEVTVFRQFGSKEALLLEAIRCASYDLRPATLPAEPVDLRDDLNRWGLAHHRAISEKRGIIRTCLAEWEERPELAPHACEGGRHAFDEAFQYLTAARKCGMIGPEGSLEAAGVMLMNAIFMDAMTRDVMPQSHVQPAADVIGSFVDVILRALDAVEPR